MNNLNKEISKIENAGYDGLLDAGLYVKNKALKQTPIKTGNLRGSAYVNGTKNTRSVKIGFSASYAIFVHEIKKNYRKGNWAFLQNAIQDNTKTILNIIKKKAKIK